MRILQVFRTPVGGLFRHVRDLVRGHAEAGHDVGIVCDSSTGGASAAALLDSVAPFCALGIRRLPMSRLPGLGDLSAARRVADHAAGLKPYLLHGHGAKGGLHARLAARRLGLPSIYTPHGGALHYRWATPHGAAFLAAERYLRRVGTGLLFVCEFEKSAYDAKIGIGGKPWKIIHNGLWPDEFATVTQSPAATDVLYIGELRHLKGVEVLIDALAILNAARRVSATIVGDGADRIRFEDRSGRLGLSGTIAFTGAMPLRQALALGKLFVMPSRAESFPYVILETAAAGLPIVASRVGGVPEILPSECMVAPGDAQALAAAIARALADPAATGARAATLAADIRDKFAAGAMCAEIAEFYGSLGRV